VVFNEMKGAYSSPDNLLYRQSRISLFPDTPYGLDSGGDPAAIPDLTYEQFKAFHETYYHPSNARICFYGNDDPEERLRFLNEWLKDFDQIEVSSSIPLQPRFEEPRAITVSYDAGEDAGEASSEAKKGMFAVNWMLAENSVPETTLGLIVLDHILIGTPASPLRKALIDSGLGEDLVGGGLNDSIRQMTFSAGLKGIEPQDADRVEALIDETLSTLAQEGIEREMIEASLNTVEFQMRELNTGRFPRGLALMFNAMSTWLHDGDPLAPLAFESPLQAIKDHLAAGERYFEPLIHQYLVENTHRATVLLKPDPNVRQEQEAAEQERLAQTKAAMGKKELRQVIEDPPRGAGDDPHADLGRPGQRKQADPPRGHANRREHDAIPRPLYQRDRLPGPGL
jgi:Zn-dependent M16 (insulinase) family peptidase